MGKPASLCLSVDVLTTAEQYEYYPALAQPADGATRQIPVKRTPAPAVSRPAYSGPRAYQLAGAHRTQI